MIIRHGKTQRHQRHASGTIRATVRNHQDCCRAKRGTINWITKTGKVVSHLVRQPHSWWSCLTIDEVASHMMRWPQSCETASQQVRLSHNKWGILTTLRQIHNWCCCCSLTSHNWWGDLTSLKQPYNSWGSLTTVMQPHKWWGNLGRAETA